MANFEIHELTRDSVYTLHTNAGHFLLSSAFLLIEDDEELYIPYYESDKFHKEVEEKIHKLEKILDGTQ